MESWHAGLGGGGGGGEISLQMRNEMKRILMNDGSRDGEGGG